MSRTVLAVAAVAVAGLAVAGPAQAVPAEDPGGCRAFGANVASLGQELGPAFGATAAGVATADQGPTFPDRVVHPEQHNLCS